MPRSPNRPLFFISWCFLLQGFWHYQMTRVSPRVRQKTNSSNGKPPLLASEGGLNIDWSNGKLSIKKAAKRERHNGLMKERTVVQSLAFRSLLPHGVLGMKERTVVHSLARQLPVHFCRLWDLMKIHSATSCRNFPPLADFYLVPSVASGKRYLKTNRTGSSAHRAFPTKPHKVTNDHVRGHRG